MTEMDGKSEDLVQDNIQALTRLFPEVACDGKVDFNKLRNLLGDAIDNAGDRYNFTWHGKDAALRLSQTPSMGTLRPCKAQSKDWDTTQNLYIEGDNLEVLKLLQKSYHGRVKMIYIDPPYNTGNDFVYHDDFRDNLANYQRLTGQTDENGAPYMTNSETSGRYHTDWLNMMYPRLKLARNLLKDDGVIFISIDDNEVERLTMICNEIFGEENFVGQIAVVNNLKGRNDKKNIATCHEYLLIFCKSPDFIAHGLPLTEEKLAEFNQVDSNGNKYQLRDLRKRGGPDRREDRPNMYFPIYFNQETKTCSLIDDGQSIAIYPIRGDGSDGRWRWGGDKVKKNLKIIEPEYSERAEGWRVKYRVYLNPSLNPTNDDDSDDNEERESKSKSFWMGSEFSTDSGRREFKQVMGSNPFDYPKAVGLLYKAIYMGSEKNDIIMDFFSGSATTAQAVMKMNADTQGNRRFILVQLPEKCASDSLAAKAGYKSICEIGEDRIRRSGELYKDKGVDVGFRVFKLDTSNLKKWQPPKDDEELVQTLVESVSNILPGRTEEDLLYEIILKMGFDLAWPIETRTVADTQVFVVADGALFICLADRITPAVAEGMAQLHRELAPEVWKVVCRDTGFRDDAAKVNVREILKAEGLDDAAFVTV